MATDTQASLREVWDWLSHVPDPEIPVISLTDLGIIRDVAWDDDTLVVTATPTYTGCRAARPSISISRRRFAPKASRSSSSSGRSRPRGHRLDGAEAARSSGIW
jgi:hypothetical protein